MNVAVVESNIRYEYRSQSKLNNTVVNPYDKETLEYIVWNSEALIQSLKDKYGNK